MIAKVFDIANFETVVFRRTQHHINRRQIAIRKHIFINEGRAFTMIRRGASNAMIQEYASRTQQAISAAEILRKVRLAHMLYHPYTGNLVEFRCWGKLSVVADHYLATIG